MPTEGVMPGVPHTQPCRWTTIAVAGGDGHREDAARELAGEGHHALAAGGLVPGEQDAASAACASGRPSGRFCPRRTAVWDICMLADIHDRSPWVEMIGLARIEEHLQDRHGGALDVRPASDLLPPGAWEPSSVLAGSILPGAAIGNWDPRPSPGRLAPPSWRARRGSTTAPAGRATGWRVAAGSALVPEAETHMAPMILEHIDSPADLKALSPAELTKLSSEIREFIVEAVTAPAATSAPTSAWSS